MVHLKCKECGRIFKYHHQLRKHRRGHSMMNRTTYRCKICNMVFSYLFKLREHLGRHFNCKSGENMYIDDLAIGVTIEPVQDTGYNWSTSHCTSLPGVGETRESPDGEPCPCAQSEKCMTVSNQHQTYSCPGCPHHIRPPCLSCPYHVHPSCCSSCPPQPGITFPRYTSTRLVNPQLVLHVDTTQDSRLSIPSSQHCVLQDNPCHCQRSCSQQNLSQSVLDNKMDYPDCRCSISTDITDKEGQYRVHATDDNYDNLEDDHADSDNTCQQTQDQIHADPGQKVNAGTSLRNMSDATVVGQSISEDKMEVSTCSKMSQTGGEEAPSTNNREKQADGDASSRSDTERSDESPINLKMSTHSTDAQADHSMEDFDDMATLNDLSNFFPDLNDNPSEQPGQVTSEGMLDNLIIGFEDGPRTNLHDKAEYVSEAAEHCKPAVSEVEARVKNGLDSAAINPTVLVSDLQSHCRGRRKNCYRCDICHVSYDTRIALVSHKRSKKHVQTQATVQEDVTNNQKRRRSDRNLHKYSIGMKENDSLPCKATQDTNTSDGRKHVALKKKCVKESGSVDHPKMHALTDELLSKIGRSGFKSGGYRRNSCGPQLKATVTKLNIKCYICGRTFTTKQHFIIHAKEHLRKLGYSEKDDDLFYCTICYAFYPCENDLREHLIDKHVNDSVATVQPLSPGRYLQQGGYPVSSVSADGRRDVSTEKVRTYCRGEGYVGRWNDTNVRPRLISWSDSDIAESTTDQLVFEEMDSPDAQVNPEAGNEEAHDYCMCHVCGDTSASLSDLDKHLKTHDKPESDVDEASDQHVGWKHRQSNRAALSPGLKHRRNMCGVCKRVLPSYYALRSHMQVHDPDRKRLRCPLCQGECVWKQNFKNHLLRHATPAGQSFSTVYFAPHSKILCPFCSEVNLYQTVDEYKKHMLVHVNKIMSEECGGITFPSHTDLLRRIPVEMKSKEEGTMLEQQRTQPLRNLFSRTYKEKSPDTLNRARSDKDTNITSDERQPVIASHLLTSTPNTHSYAPDITANLNITDGSPEGSLQGNSGLFMSPEWGCNYSNPGSTGRQSGNPVYTQIATQEFATHAGNLLKRPGMNQLRSFLIEPDLNDSGSIQTFSGESDVVDVTGNMPVQKLPSFHALTAKLHTHDPSHQSLTQPPLSQALTQVPPTRAHSQAMPRTMLNTSSTKQYSICSGSNNASRSLRTGPAFTSQVPQSVHKSHPREFLSLERVSELMKTTSHFTETFVCEGQPCSICQTVVLTPHNVKEHLFSHFDCNGRFTFIKRDRKHECPICLKMVGERRSATAHLFSHWGANILRCPVCNKPFNFLKTLKVHAQKNHPDFQFSLSLFDNV
ncbi:uncharacterized protein [Haliotis asinina]|uniref:uncharacterized protein n=1 Tax=Haliotis asinina TaxID=109174 RepID=UPI003531E4A7